MNQLFGLDFGGRRMTNKQLQDILKIYPDNCNINIEKCGMYENGEIVSIRVDYINNDNFEIPDITIEYEKDKDIY